jgi:hypothetical protein
MDPGLFDPQNSNSALMATSPAQDSGIDINTDLGINNQDGADPSLIAITAPIIRTVVWDRGTYEYK